MRLTLRTLLSYLDDTLEPAQAKTIGAKVAESETARDLMERIKQVTRRRRLTTPPTTGPGGMDANTIAEYLDNEVGADQANEVEQICLASDVHLAEVAACHQILTLVLGEPALVPPSAKQRMYGIVKGPESIPFRKPPKATSKEDNDLSSEIEPDQDEAVRLGTTASGTAGPNRNALLMIGGGVLAACLLIFAIYQITRTPGGNKIDNRTTEPIAQNGKTTSPVTGSEGKTNTPSDKTKTGDKTRTEKEKKTGAETKGEPKLEDFKIEKPRSVKYAEANLKEQKIGRYLVPTVKDPPSVLLQFTPAKIWERVGDFGDKSVEVSSARTLMSLSGSESSIVLDSDVEVMLSGNLPEWTRDDINLESRAMLHSSEELDADITLERGRVILRNRRSDGKDAYARVRFNNPTLSRKRPEGEYVDILLYGRDAAVVVERFCVLNRDEPFFEDPKAADRKGPIAVLRVFAFNQSARVQMANDSFTLDKNSRPALEWNSVQGILGPPKREVLPPWIGGTPTLKTKEDELARKKAVAAHSELIQILNKRDKTKVEVARNEFVENFRKDLVDNKLTADTFARWRHAVRCAVAFDDTTFLIEELRNEKTDYYIRVMSIQMLQSWLAQGREQDYRLLETLENSTKYRKTECIKVMELLHPVSIADAEKPATYQALIDGLSNKLVPIRALSQYHLVGLVAPKGKVIAYDAGWPDPLRDAAIREWRILIPPGQLPGVMPKKDK